VRALPGGGVAAGDVADGGDQGGEQGARADQPAEQQVGAGEGGACWAGGCGVRLGGIRGVV